MAKTTPPGVEAIMISLTMTIINLNLGILRSFIGVKINSMYVGVTKDDLRSYNVLCLIALVSRFYPFFFINYLIKRN